MLRTINRAIEIAITCRNWAQDTIHSHHFGARQGCDCSILRACCAPYAVVAIRQFHQCFSCLYLSFCIVKTSKIEIRLIKIWSRPYAGLELILCFG